MLNKLQLYDIFTALVPGILLLSAVSVTFPDLVALFALPELPDAFIVLALTILAVFIGHLVQAVASLLEPALHFTWGGRPSEVAMKNGLGDRYFPKATADRIAAKIRTKVGETTSDRPLFLYAMMMAEADDKSRASSFNGSYAYHRAILMLAVTTTVLVAASGKCGVLATATWPQYITLLGLLIAITLLLWYRCKQRAFYYVREVLGTAERQLDKAQ